MVASPVRAGSRRLRIFPAFLLALGAFAATAHAQPYGHWTRLGSDARPSGRRAAGAAYDSQRHRLIVFGGFPVYLNDVWALDLATERWHPLSPSGTPPTPRYGATAIYDAENDRLIVFGGFDGSVQRNDVWQLTLGTLPVWTQLSPTGAPPPGRSFHAAVYDAPRSRMILFGGFDGGFLGDVWELSLSGAPAWTARTFAQPSPAARNIAAMAIDTAGDRLMLFGGWSGDYRDDTWILPLGPGAEWSELLTAHRPPPRREISMAYDPAFQRMALFGGNSGYPRWDTWVLSLQGTPDWNEAFPGVNAHPRYGHNTVFDPVAGRVLLYGGLENTGHSSRVWSLSSDLLEWSEVALLLPARRNYSLVRDPVANSMILFGGELPATPQLTNEVFEFDLATDVWRAVPPIPSSPTQRYAQRAVWDAIRDRMLVFGGYDTDFRNDLWEYRPRPTPTWTLLSPGSTPPPGRFAGGLVHDRERDRLVIFGGYRTEPNPFPPPQDFPIPLNDVWSLPLSGPGAMLWQQESPSGAPPTPRWGQVMLMDEPRDRALVFGGGATDVTGTSELFALDLAVNPPAWSLLPAAQSPPGRLIHAGVIDVANDQLVTFGGYSGDPPGPHFLDDLWVYPLSGPPTWSQLPPTLPLPSARNSIGAVYDAARERIVVPAGFGQTGFFGDTWAFEWDTPVPVLVSLASIHAEPGRVSIEWSVRDGAITGAIVERRESDGEWEAMGAAVRAGHERLHFEDETAVEGSSYGYRLRLRDEDGDVFSEEVRIEVPTSHRLELAGAWPNPTVEGPLTIALSLARRGPAMLELFDVTGRSVARRDLSGLAAGRHRVVLGGERLVPGVYAVRLVAEGRALITRALVLR